MRKILLDQFTLMNISLTQQLANILGAPSSDLRAVICSTLFQSGATNFEILRAKGWEVELDSQFLKDRSRIIESEELNEYEKKLTKAFSRLLPDEFGDDDKDSIWAHYYSPVTELIRLLACMSVANKRNTSFIATSKPDMEQLQIVLPFDIFTSASNFLSRIQSLTVDAPIPVQSIATHHLSRFNEIISSDLFSDYSKSRVALEQEETHQGEAIANASAAARRLYSRYIDVLKLKRLIASMIPIAGKAVEIVLGALPAKVSDVIGESFSSKLTGQRAICFYQFNNIYEEFMDMIPGVREAEEMILDKDWRKKIPPPHNR